MQMPAPNVNYIVINQGQQTAGANGLDFTNKIHLGGGGSTHHSGATNQMIFGGAGGSGA